MKNQLTQMFAEILKSFGAEDAEISFEFPENSEHGDYTTNIAMLLSKRLKAPPREIAQKIVDTIKKKQTVSPYPWLDRIEIAGPGFINIYLSPGYFGSIVEKVLEQKDLYGKGLKEPSGAQNTVSDADGKGYADGPAVPGHETVINGTKIVDKKGKTSAKEASDAGKTSQESASASFGKKSESDRNVAVQKNREASQFAAKSPQTATIVVEFAHPNTHKAFHIGHLRNITTGESLIRLLESQGNPVKRVNYQGDVGMHIAKALYALLELSPYKDDVQTVKGVKSRVEFLGKAYAAGSKAFEEDKKAEGIIKDLNALIYASAQQYAKEVGRNPGTTDYLTLVQNHVHPLETVYELWKETRQWSLDYFDTIYKRVYTHYDRFYFESECLSGVDRAKAAVKAGILKESDGAIILDGKPYGIDTRVFVNSKGLPTYEGKELALAPMESTEFGPVSRIIHVVGPEQASFFTVTFKAEELLGIVKPGVQKHHIYGWVKLKHGKMSSRSGNVVLGEWLIDEVKKAIQEIISGNTLKQNDINVKEASEALAIGAIKYAFLKVSTNQEIAFDLKESINTNGDSGPYLMYCYARCKSVLRKAIVIPASEPESKTSVEWIPGPLRRSESEAGQARDDNMNPEEHAAIRYIAQFPEIVRQSAKKYAPNTLCTYLFQLAQAFNLLYAKHPIADNAFRLSLTAATAQVLKNGLYLLGIRVLERM